MHLFTSLYVYTSILLFKKMFLNTPMLNYYVDVVKNIQCYEFMFHTFFHFSMNLNLEQYFIWWQRTLLIFVLIICNNSTLPLVITYILKLQSDYYSTINSYLSKNSRPFTLFTASNMYWIVSGIIPGSSGLPIIV